MKNKHVKKIDPAEKDIPLPKGFKKLRGMPCIHPEHNPPMHMVYSTGENEHTCPGCGHSIRFFVGGIM